MIDYDASIACRICLEDGATFPLFENIENNESIHHKLASCLKENIEDIKGYPRNICLKCKNASETICSFMKKLRDSCKILETELLVVKTEVIDNDNCYEPFVYEIEVSKQPVVKLYPEKVLELIKPLPNLTVKRVKLSESDDQVSERIKIDDLHSKIKKGKPKGSIKAKKVTIKKPSNGIRGQPKGPSKSLKDPTWTTENKKARSMTLECIRQEKVAELKLKHEELLEKLRAKAIENPAPPKLCDICGQTFNSSYKLATHRIAVHAEKKFKCTKCPKRFPKEQHLNDHIKYHHEKVRNFICDTCGKGFFKRKILTDHVRYIHSGLKKKKMKPAYKCNFCDKTYSYKRGIIVHERSAHTGERPCICNVCNSSFYDIVYLREHMRLHTGETPYKCPICGRGYAQRCNMKSHLRNHKISAIDPETLKKIKPSYFKFMRP